MSVANLCIQNEPANIITTTAEQTYSQGDTHVNVTTRPQKGLFFTLLPYTPTKMFQSRFLLPVKNE